MVSRQLAPHVSEAAFQGALIGLAQATGWMVAHFRPVEDKDGVWRTAVAADGKGFPDLVLVHRRRGVIFAELKSHRGVLSDEQRVWRDQLVAAGASWHVWKPADWDEIEKYLKGRR